MSRPRNRSAFLKSLSGIRAKNLVTLYKDTAFWRIFALVADLGGYAFLIARDPVFAGTNWDYTIGRCGNVNAANDDQVDVVAVVAVLSEASAAVRLKICQY